MSVIVHDKITLDEARLLSLSLKTPIERLTANRVLTDRFDGQTRSFSFGKCSVMAAKGGDLSITGEKDHVNRVFAALLALQSLST